ncbi:uncharacterized protein NPIL_50181 [Nephila pilipes]|uniref:Uncharacterized protein n=1 Tax=Nephila pilipes TaxID=299642 RepID=A0A8X6TWF8_NEPPI|nr:uncharacterized protein NPIL_50181 [Nephila pilipes]
MFSKNTRAVFRNEEEVGSMLQILYSALFIAGIVHAQTLSRTASMLGFCLLMVVLSGTCIICSIIMLIGLFKDNRFLLLPWTVAVSMTTLIDVMVSFYLIRDAIDEPFLAVLFVTDVLICAINPRDPEAPPEQPQRPPVTTSASVTDDVNSSNALLVPPEKIGAGPSTSTPKFMYCELTTISEEINTGTPTTPKELCITSFIDSPSKRKSPTDKNQPSEI